ncbi:hypothetical protein Sarmat_01196 [Rickettsiales endosymbiont of Paramecium tredecaurelia]|nr:hypothetical protein [Candidatus Sarmatiella mevalonica]
MLRKSGIQKGFRTARYWRGVDDKGFILDLLRKYIELEITYREGLIFFIKRV